MHPIFFTFSTCISNARTHTWCSHSFTARRHPSAADWRSQINNPYMPIVNHRVQSVFFIPRSQDKISRGCTRGVNRCDSTLLTSPHSTAQNHFQAFAFSNYAILNCCQCRRGRSHWKSNPEDRWTRRRIEIFGVEFYGVVENRASAWRLKMVACGRTKGSRAICGSSAPAIEAHIAGHSTLHTPPYIIRSRHTGLPASAIFIPGLCIKSIKKHHPSPFCYFILSYSKIHLNSIQWFWVFHYAWVNEVLLYVYEFSFTLTIMKISSGYNIHSDPIK